MSRKLDRLHTPQAYVEIEKAYQEMSILEVACEFKTSHETIRKILIKNGVKIRKKGEHSDSAKVGSAAYSVSKIIRKYPTHLHGRIMKRVGEYLF
mgnify:CR=1 FL=1|jgi:hypothetical protein